MKRPRAWPRAVLENRLMRAALRHQFWRKWMGSLGPRYILAPVGQATMYLDLLEPLGVSRLILKHGHHEKTVSKLLPEWVGSSGDVIDVGANIGYFTVLSALQTTGTVYAFEPEPHSFQLLVRNVAVNDLRNVELFDKAAGETRGICRLYISERNLGDHTLYASRDSKRSVEVEMVPIDEELAGLDRVSFVKIDVQGFEERVIHGMSELLARNRGVTVLSEFEPGSIEASGASPGDLLDLMESLGFEWLSVDEKSQGLVAADRASLYARCGPEGHVNVCFSRPSAR